MILYMHDLYVYLCIWNVSIRKKKKNKKIKLAFNIFETIN